MSWTVTIPGQPVSGNHANKIGRGYRRGGIPFPKIVKTSAAEAYQNGAAFLVRTARPSGWKWDGRYVVVEYRMYLAEPEPDATNVIKVLEDAIFPALGIDDRWALPRVMHKEVVRLIDARVEVTLL